MSESAATPEPEKKKGPWANRVVGTEIEHTPEYDAFMKDLAEYHEKRGTHLAPEPELGRKLLDLHKLYKTVTGQGGYDKITETKGAWRDIANTYKPPVNNTNAGYLLKTIYYKNLAAYEISKFFNKEPPPKEWLEDRSAAGGAIMTRTAEDFEAVSPKPEANGDSASPPPLSEKRNLRTAPTPRSFYAPDTTPQRHNPPRAAAMNQSSQNGVNGSIQFPSFPQPQMSLPIGRPVSTPRTAPHEFPARKRKIVETNGVSNMPRIGGGVPGATLVTRVLMGLKSGLPAEIDYALEQLVRISFECDDFRLANLAEVSDMLLAKVQEVERLIGNKSVHSKADGVDHIMFTKPLEKISAAALILRNLAINPENARELASRWNMKGILTMVLSLPQQPALAELRGYAFDMLESMATYFSYDHRDSLFDLLFAGLESDDRGELLASLKSLCRLVVGRDDYNRVGDVPMPAVMRITSLLMLEDEDLTSACLDFLYHYTSNEENIEKLLQPPTGIETIKQLTRLMLFQGITGEQLVYLKASRQKQQPLYNIPQLPQDIVNELLMYAEPERATKWMRCCFEEDAEADITQIALWQAYQQRFAEYVQNGFPLLPAAEFIKNVSVAFQSASAMVLPTSEGQKFIIKGIRARETPMDLKGHIYIACKWHEQHGMPASQCRAMLATPQDLWLHVLGTHLAPPPPDTEHFPLLCNWANCNRFAPHGEKSRAKVLPHVRTHMPDNTSFHRLPREEQEMLEDPEGRVIINRCQTGTDERGEAAGIPLTSVLVLRNIKRRGGDQASTLLSTCAGQFFEVMAVNKPLAPYVCDLVDGL